MKCIGIAEKKFGFKNSKTSGSKVINPNHTAESIKYLVFQQIGKRYALARIYVWRRVKISP